MYTYYKEKKRKKTQVKERKEKKASSQLSLSQDVIYVPVWGWNLIRHHCFSAGGLFFWTVKTCRTSIRFLLWIGFPYDPLMTYQNMQSFTVRDHAFSWFFGPIAPLFNNRISNHTGRYKLCSEWDFTVEPAQIQYVLDWKIVWTTSVTNLSEKRILDHKSLGPISWKISHGKYLRNSGSYCWTVGIS